MRLSSITVPTLKATSRQTHQQIVLCLKSLTIQGGNHQVFLCIEIQKDIWF